MILLKMGELNAFGNAPSHTLVRDHIGKPNHVAGITSLQSNGMRYVYGLPVKNISQEELTFSVNGSTQTCQPTIKNYLDSSGDLNYKEGDEYLDHNKVPEYTHTHLLTAVLGADYVDLGEPGISDEDYGYWVKFTYVKTSNNYQWKTPYHGANYLRGNIQDNRDDKASITYGKREQYYLSTAETKTHIAEFSKSIRNDAKGASSLLQTNGSDNTPAGASYKLDQIALFSKIRTI